MKIAIGSDHAGTTLKGIIKTHLTNKNIVVEDFGVQEGEKGDYPIYGEKVANAVVSGVCDLGVLICGSGIGISISANKVPGIRAVVCSEPYSAQMSRRHNNTNILAMGERVVGSELALMILDAWLDAEFEGGRHADRVDLITEIEKNINYKIKHKK